MKRTAIIGATPNPSRYAFIAAEMLTEYAHEIIPIGIKRGSVQGKEILDIRQSPDVEEVHTITMYVGPPNQVNYYDYLLGLGAQRMIFNPGSENDELANLARSKGIEVEYACTLVMLRLGQY